MEELPRSTIGQVEIIGLGLVLFAWQAEVFEEEGALDKLEDFASHFGPDFYRLPRNTDTVTLVREAQQVAPQLPLGDTQLTPLRAGESIAWQVR